MSTDPVPRTNGNVAVCCEHRLVGEAVRAGLASQGFATTMLRWPVHLSARQEWGEQSPDAAVLLCGTTGFDDVNRMLAPVREVPVPWLVLHEVPRGPLWGAALASGAIGVKSAGIGLDELAELLDRVLTGVPLIDAQERASLVSSWLDAREQRRVLRRRLSSLSPRETNVLNLLYAGQTVRTIARGSGVLESTVRSQIRSILRKLGVRSQMAAVAIVGELIGGDPVRGRPVGGGTHAVVGCAR